MVRRSPPVARRLLPRFAGPLVCVLPALTLLILGQQPRNARAVTLPPAVHEYDFGAAGPAGDLQWGGRAVAVDISPADKSVALVASTTGGLWRTADGGVTWSHVSGFPMFFPHDVAYDPNDQNIVFATTDYDNRVVARSGIWRSTDGGSTWSRTSATYPCTTKPSAWSIGTVAGADTHSKVFVANDCGVAYSNDSGTTWTNVDPSGGSPTVFWGLTATRTGAGSASAYACSSAGLYEATVTGSAAPTWTTVSTAPQVSAGNWCQVAISPLNSDVLFLTTDVGVPYEIDIDRSTTPATAIVTALATPSAGDGAREPHLLTHRALDGDATHFDLYFSNGVRFYRQHCNSDGDPATRDCTTTAESGAQCTNAVDDDGDQMVNEGCPKVGLAESETTVPSQCKGALDEDGDGAVNDGCAVMERFDNGTHDDSNDIAFDPTVPDGTGCPLLTTNDGGVGRSTDCGVTWADSNAGMRAQQIYNVWGTLRGSGGTDTDIYFGTHDNEWWYSLDNGGTWLKAFCCEGFLGQADYRVPPGGLTDIRMVFVNCAGCGNQTSGRGFAGNTSWPNPPGGAWGTDRIAAAPIMFGHERYVQVGSDMRSPPSFRLYVMQPETGTQCSNSADDDGDGAVNDGCPPNGSPETGAQCHNASDDDGDGAINDGCSHIFSAETGSECTDATDDDGDGVVNDGCATTGAKAEAGAQCMDALDANEDGAPDAVNDGCPQVGVWGQMGPSFTEPPNRAPIVPAGPATGPTFYFGVEASAGTWRLRKMSGAMNATAALSDASGSGGSTLSAVQQVGNQFYYPLVFAADPQNPAHLYAADSSTSQMKFSEDGGATWQVDTELTALVTNHGEFNFAPWRIVYDPEDSQRILVATHSAGIIASVNGGKDWFTLEGSVNQIPMVTSFFFDNDHDVIYATSFGRGLWTLTLPEADLSVTKTDSPDPAVAGGELFYTITATNGGPQPATVEVVDTLPPEVKFVDDNLPPPLGCTEDPAGTLTCEVGALDVGQSASFQVKVEVKPDAVINSGPKAIFNSVSVRGTDTTDPDTTNNTISDPTFVEDSADLQVTKLCKPDTNPQAGSPIDCTVFVDNHGPSDARGVVVDDVMLSSNAFTVSDVNPAISTGTPGCTLADVPGGKRLTCRLGNVAAASTAVPGRATVTYRLAANEGQDLNNVATVRSDTPDPDATNNEAQVTLTVQAVADLSLVKSAPASVVAGTALTWTITATNVGPSTAVNALIEDTVPAGVTITSVDAPSGSCTTGVPGDPFQPTTCGFDSLALQGSRTMTINAVVLSQTTGILHNDARVSSATFDSDNSNDFAHSDTAVQVQSDVTISVAATPDPVVAGTALSYQVTVGNAGPSRATGLVLADPLPASLTLTSTAVSGGTGSCGLQTTTNTVQCALPDLDPGQNVFVFVYTLVSPSTPASPPPISNMVTVTSASPDPNTPNNATVDTGVITRADLGITLTSDKETYKPSTVIHYTITVVNGGPSDALNVVVTQQLPPPKTGFYVSNTAGCPPPSGATFTCALGTIPAGGSRTFQLNVFIRGNKGTIAQTATVSSSTTDLDAVNNSSTRVVTVK